MSKVLYVEDHPAQRDILAQMLELNGLEVAVASDGLEGVEKARTWQPDLVLMDLRMPKMDGFEATKVIRSEDNMNHIPIIAISAWASPKHKERALASGANEHFTKPVDLSRLVITLSRYINDPVLAKNAEELRGIQLEKAEGVSVYAKKMELEYQAKIWQISPELASTLEQLTKLTGGIIHDLRNRLGILQNYASQANYCLRLLSSLAFLRFRPSLSLEECYGSKYIPEILINDLTEFSPDDMLLRVTRLERKKGKETRKNSKGITAKGSIDSQMITQALWLLFQGMAECISESDGDQTIAINIEDKRLLDRQIGFHITISSKPSDILPSKIDLANVLSGDRVGIYRFLLEKAVFLNNGTIAILENGTVEIKLANPSVNIRNGLETLHSSIAKITEKVSILSKHFDGPDPNIYPLIKGFVAAITRELEDIAEEAQEERSSRTQEIIQRNCSYAKLLLQNLLWLGAGAEPPKELIDVGNTLRSVRDIMRSEIRERSDDDDEDDGLVSVDLEIQPNLPSVLANEVSLQQVFMNLITNALEAMPESGILTLSAFRKGSQVYAEVKDTGVGISSGNIVSVFDLAYSTKQGQERGTGLHIVKSIVDKLGGRVEVESEVAVGTTFRVCLQSS